MGEELVLREEHFLDLLFEVLFNGQLEFLPTRVPCLYKRIGHHLRKIPGLCMTEMLAKVITNLAGEGRRRIRGLRS